MKKVMLLFSLLMVVNIGFSQEENGNQEVIKGDAIPPPPPPPPLPKPSPELFGCIQEEMPRFPGCEDIEDKAARKKCADAKMLEFLYDNLNYPAEAKRDSVEGMVVIRFVVEKDGTLTHFEIVRDKIGHGCGEEALRVSKLMPNWIPGRQRERAVRVQFNLPIKFKL